MSQTARRLKVFVSAMREWRRATVKGLTSDLRELKSSVLARIERNMSLTITREMDRPEKGMNFLASIGSVSPFVGLFGTVWGLCRTRSLLLPIQKHKPGCGCPGLLKRYLPPRSGYWRQSQRLRLLTNFQVILTKSVHLWMCLPTGVYHPTGPSA